MSPPDLTPAPGQEWDGYGLIRFLGRGGFGEVWLCRSGATGHCHALKFISGRDPELLEKEHHSLTLYRNATSRDVQRIAEKVRARLQQGEPEASPGAGQ